MKSIKKMFALMLAMVMCFSMSGMAVFAAETTYTLTISPNMENDAQADAHLYTAYKIFGGELDEASGKKILNNIVWGNGITTAGQNALYAYFSLDGTTDAKAKTAANVAKELQNIQSNSAALDAVAKIIAANVGTKANTPVAGATQIAGLTAGYYFVQDEASLDTTQSAYTRYILQVLSNVTVAPKASVPKVEKKVKDKNDSATDAVNNAEAFQDSADYDIGDAVPFKLTATLGTGMSKFTKYSLTFNDTPSAGLTMPADVSAFTITVKDANGNAFVKDTDYVVSYTPTAASGSTPQSFKLNIKLKKMGTAIEDNEETLDVNEADNRPAQYLTSAWDNATVEVTYTMTLNNDAVIGSAGNLNTVNLTYSNNPNSDSDSTEGGKTPDDKVIVFTYKTVFTKLNDEQNPLAGAQFKLYKVASDYTLTNLQDADGNALTKNTAMTPATVTAITNKLATDKKQDYTAVVSAGATAGINNVFTFKGLDDGRYILVETTTPAGYNTMLPLIFDVTATHATTDASPSAATLTALNGNSITGEINTQNLVRDTAAGQEDALKGDVINNIGAVLPSTGGIGTTMFYIIGAILVIGAGVVLVSRRRMNA